MIKLRKMKSVGMALLATIAQSAFAQDAQLVVSQCIVNNMTTSYKIISETNKLKLISVPEKDIATIRIVSYKNHCGGFFNATNVKQNNFLKKITAADLLASYQMPEQSKALINQYRIEHETMVKTLINTIQPNHIWDSLSALTAFSDRAGNTDNGVKAANFLKAKFEKMAEDAGRTDTQTRMVSTGTWYKQPSVVTVVGKNLPGEAVVIGAHMDTLPYNKPGADDDGSGSATLMEVARVMLNSKAPLTHPVYFIWYAAEEVGLVGSQHVVSDFVQKQIPVKAVLQFDMTGYRYHGESTLWLLRDNVNQSLTDFVSELVKKYTDVKVDFTRCGYGCSDHASWTRKGFKAAAPFEAKFGQEDPYIHSSRDTMEHVSLEHMTNFAKLGIAFVVELAS